MSRKLIPKKYLSADSLIKQIRAEFEKIPDHRAKNVTYSLPDGLMAAFAMFSLKSTSLLGFQKTREDKLVWANIKSVYRCEKVPKDGQMRNILDEIDPQNLRSPFKKIFAKAQRGKVLEGMSYYDGYYLLAVDGCEVFNSENVFSDNCLERKRRNGKIEYYQQFLGSAIVHPEKKEVIPFCPEMILKQDGNDKNDCERNASKRFLKKFRREHPFLKVIVLEDALSANAPHLKTLKKNNCRFIINIKPKGNKYIFDQLEMSKKESSGEVTEFEIQKNVTLNPKGQKMKNPKTRIHKFIFAKNISLNKSNQEVKINVLDYSEYDDKTKKIMHFSWITDLDITMKNAYQIMRCGRARWRIENETFNTLTNLGYNLKHNFGLGKKHLSTNFINLMMLAFLVDQIQQLCCPLFQAALGKKGGKKYLWDKIRSLFGEHIIDSFATMHKTIVYGKKGKPPDILLP